MASRYHSFNVFMNDVIQKANEILNDTNRGNLEELFEIKNKEVVEIIISII